MNQSAELQALQGQVTDLTTHLEGLEKERDFYFAKLRDIEILVQQQMETLEAEGKEDKTLKEIQAILYSTEVRAIQLDTRVGYGRTDTNVDLSCRRALKCLKQTLRTKHSRVGESASVRHTSSMCQMLRHRCLWRRCVDEEIDLRFSLECCEL